MVANQAAHQVKRLSAGTNSVRKGHRVLKVPKDHKVSKASKARRARRARVGPQDLRANRAHSAHRVTRATLVRPGREEPRVHKDRRANRDRQDRP